MARNLRGRAAGTGARLARGTRILRKSRARVLRPSRSDRSPAPLPADEGTLLDPPAIGCGFNRSTQRPRRMPEMVTHRRVFVEADR